MALAGTLKDFSLADIFQLIALQKKTGYLTLRNPADVVTVTFMEGTVVGAESLNKRIEDRLGHVLVKTGRITKEELAKALEVQKETLQRLGYILVAEKFVDSQSLRAALSIQMQQTIFRLFRWKDGDYNFEPRDSVEYDRENVTPMAAESILMEGIRMLDEWPLIEKKIPTFDLVFEKIPLPMPPVLEHRVETAITDDGLGFLGVAKKDTSTKSDAEAAAVRLSQEEMAAYQHVNGLFTVQEIIDRAGLNEFETCKALFELFNRNLIRPAVPGLEQVAVKEKRGFLVTLPLAEYLVPIFWGWIALSVALLPLHPLDHLPWGAGKGDIERDVILKRESLQRVAYAIQAFQIRNGRLPNTLEELARGGYMPMRNLSDTEGIPLFYQVSGNSYTLAARTGGDKVLEDLTITSVEAAE